jgi:multidrug efflux pump subunit AcrB
VNLSEPFIRRPVATSLMAGALAFLGLAAFPFLPVAPLPQVDFPTVLVTATLAGASAETMATSVATPLERQIGQIAGITEMTSFSALGATSITVQFDLNRNIDLAAQDVQAAITAASKTLPQTMTARPTYKKLNPADAPILILSASSDTLPITVVDEYADSFLDFPGRWRRPGLARRRAAAGDSDPGRSCKARRTRLDAGGSPRRAPQCDDQRAQGLTYEFAHEPDHRGQ